MCYPPRKPESAPNTPWMTAARAGHILPNTLSNIPRNILPPRRATSGSFSRSVLFHTKTRVSPKYPVNDCNPCGLYPFRHPVQHLSPSGAQLAEGVGWRRSPLSWFENRKKAWFCKRSALILEKCYLFVCIYRLNSHLKCSFMSILEKKHAFIRFLFFLYKHRELQTFYNSISSSVGVKVPFSLNFTIALLFFINF